MRLRLFILTYCLALFAIAVPFLAEASQTISSIEVSGNTATSTETILATIKSKKGGPYSRDTVQSDVKALWKLGQFQDIQVEKEDTTAGIVLKFSITEKPIITKINFKGNKKIKKDELEKEVTLRTYRPLSENELAESFKINVNKKFARITAFNFVRLFIIFSIFASLTPILYPSYNADKWRMRLKVNDSL